MSILGFDALGTTEAILGGIPLADSGIVSTELRFFADEDFISATTDSAANRYYRTGVMQAYRGNRSVISGVPLAGRLGLSNGEITIANPDGALDSMIVGGALDGRSVVVRSIQRGETLDDAIKVFEGITEAVEFDTNICRLKVRSRDDLLRDKVQSAQYTGAGGAEGGVDLDGKNKPIALGKSWGVPPVYVGVISGKETYQVSSGWALPIQDVPAFTDRGVALTKVASAPTSGEYSIDIVTGLITIGGNRPELPTCDVQGYPPTFLGANTATIIKAIFEDGAALSNRFIDFDSLTALANDQPAAVGIWIGTGDRSVNSVILELLQGIGSFGGFSRLGKYTVGLIQEPDTAPLEMARSVRGLFDDTNIVRLEHIRGPGIINPPAWRIAVGWKRNYTVTSDIATATAEAQAAFMQREFSEAVAIDNTVRTRHARSVSVFLPGLFALQADAQTEADRLIAFLPNKRLWRITTRNASPNLDIGQVVRIDKSRFGLNQTLGTILGVETNLQTRETRMDVLT